MKSAFRFRIYPNRKQERRLLMMVEAGRRLWNDALAHRKRRWEEKRLSTSYSQQCSILTVHSLSRGRPIGFWESSTRRRDRRC